MTDAAEPILLLAEGDREIVCCGCGERVVLHGIAAIGVPSRPGTGPWCGACAVAAAAADRR